MNYLCVSGLEMFNKIDKKNVPLRPMDRPDEVIWKFMAGIHIFYKKMQKNLHRCKLKYIYNEVIWKPREKKFKIG